jgi:hypothetical protein
VGEEASMSKAPCHPERGGVYAAGGGRKVTRLTLGALSTCLVLGRPRGLSMDGQKSAEGEKDRRSDPRPEHVNPSRCHDLVDRRRRCHES